LSELDRTRRLLSQLYLQAGQIRCDVELLILYNPGQIDVAVISATLHRAGIGGRKPPQLHVRVECSEGLHYYDLKNEGARRATGEIIVFTDSDVVPEEGWLRSMVDPLLSDPGISVVAGCTYVDPENLVSKAFALGWFFPLRHDKPALSAEGSFFFANNLAFRRRMFLENLFPPMPAGSTRGACAQLRQQLLEKKINVWTNSGAQVSHPAPNGWKHFLVRGLAHGRDEYFYFHTHGESRSGSCCEVLKRGFRRLNQMIPDTWAARERLHLNAFQIPAAIGIMIGYYSLALLGAVIVALLPDSSRKWWKI
jgi:hypothetical protein